MILDSLEQMQELDKEDIYSSITSLPDQMKAAWKDVNEMSLSPEYKMAKNIVLAGMGGSALAGRLIQSLFADNIPVPFEVCTGYKLPGFVNENSLVILSSYSGGTEETVSSFHDAISKGAHVFGIATGGKLVELFKESELPIYLIDPKFNPSKQPRMSLGYQIVGALAVLNKLGFISISGDQIEKTFNETADLIQSFSARTPSNDNTAKVLANKLKGQIPILISSEHLYESLHITKNQINENAKNFALHFAIPELNHHLMEGLRFPEISKKFFHFVFFESDLYSDRVKLRYPITQEVVEKNGYQYSNYELQSKTKLTQAFEVLVLGSYISFYLAMLEGIDPSPIPWVDYFKQQLK